VAGILAAMDDLARRLARALGPCIEPAVTGEFSAGDICHGLPW
jgi:hypothetical protein